MKMGYTEKQIGRMYFGKWCDLFDVYKTIHNMEATKTTYELPKKEISLTEL